MKNKNLLFIMILFTCACNNIDKEIPNNNYISTATITEIDISSSSLKTYDKKGWIVYDISFSDDHKKAFITWIKK